VCSEGKNDEGKSGWKGCTDSFISLRGKSVCTHPISVCLSRKGFDEIYNYSPIRPFSVMGSKCEGRRAFKKAKLRFILCSLRGLVGTLVVAILSTMRRTSSLSVLVMREVFSIR
jgi:hypothetical protein